MIVYSSNIGDKDTMRHPLQKYDGVEYIYLVDDKTKYESELWDVREVTPRFEDTRLAAKWYKMHPHLLFPGEDTIWVDGNYRPKGDPRGLVTNDIVLFRHASPRRCLYEEAEACLGCNAGDPVAIKAQIDEYKRQGMPSGYGLYQGNVLIRRGSISSFNEAWWDQITTFSSRDQISLPYVIWKHDIDFLVLGHSEKRQYFMKSGKHRFHGTKQINE